MTRTKYLVRKAIANAVNSPAPFMAGCYLGMGCDLFVEKRQIDTEEDERGARYMLSFDIVSASGRAVPRLEVGYWEIPREVDRKEFAESLTEWLIEENKFLSFLEADDEVEL